MEYNGQLKGFPPEIVEKMLEYQEAQGSKRDISVFENKRTVSNINNGFTWDRTPEGHSFWSGILNNRNFDIFFKKYPKKKEDVDSWSKLVKKAETEYGKGVKYKHISNTITIKSKENVSTGFIRSNRVSNSIWIDDQPGFIYLDGKWAEIIEEKSLGKKFKEGDKVYFITKSANAKFFKNGTTHLTIKSWSPQISRYRVEEADRSTSWNVEEDELDFMSNYSNPVQNFEMLDSLPSSVGDMFSKPPVFQNVDIQGWDTSKLTDFSSLGSSPKEEKEKEKEKRLKNFISDDVVIKPLKSKTIKTLKNFN